MCTHPRMVPGAEARGLVAPSMAARGVVCQLAATRSSRNEETRIADVLRPVFTASRPSQTMAAMGPPQHV